MYVLKIHDKLFGEDVYWMRGARFANTRCYFYEADLFYSKSQAYEYATYLITNDFVRKDITINDFEAVWVDEVDPEIYKERYYE